MQAGQISHGVSGELASSFLNDDTVHGLQAPVSEGLVVNSRLHTKDMRSF
jgi:hypothetical protein